MNIINYQMHKAGKNNFHFAIFATFVSSIINALSPNTMKLKSIFLFLAVALLTSFISCSSDDDGGDGLDYKKLPQTARAFIESRLPGYDVLNIQQVDDKGDEGNEKYVVTMSSDITLSFSSLGFWRRMESNSELPELLQREISYDGAARVIERYPSATINKIYFVMYGYKVVLNNDTHVAVYTDNGTEMKVGIDKKGDVNINQNIHDFIVAYLNYSGLPPITYYMIEEDPVDGQGYRLGISDGVRIFFDKDGNWKYIDKLSKGLGIKMYEGLLPLELRSIIEDKYSGNAQVTRQVLRTNGYYYVVLSETVSHAPVAIMYDSTTKKEIEASIQSATDFLDEYTDIRTVNITFS